MADKPSASHDLMDLRRDHGSDQRPPYDLAAYKKGPEPTGFSGKGLTYDSHGAQHATM